MRDYILLEVRRTLRDKGFVIFGIGMPVLMYVLFTHIGAASEGQDDWRVGVMVSMAAYGALGAALSSGNGVAEDKALGWLRQLRITPLSPTKAVVGRGITSSVTVLPHDRRRSAGGRRRQRGAAGGLAVGGPGGAAVAGHRALHPAGPGQRVPPQLADHRAGQHRLHAGARAAGRAVVPLGGLPRLLRELSGWTPAHRFADLGWSVTEGHLPGPTTVLVLLAWLAAFGSYAVYAYRRAAREV